MWLQSSIEHKIRKVDLTLTDPLHPPALLDPTESLTLAPASPEPEASGGGVDGRTQSTSTSAGQSTATSPLGT